MKKQMAVLLTGMILMTQPVYGADLIEKEPVKVTGDSVHAPEVETNKDKETIGIAKGEEPKDAVQEMEENETNAELQNPNLIQENAETENAEVVPKLEGKNVAEAMELLEEEGLNASVWFEDTEESEETAKRKEAVRNAAKDVESMPEKLEIDGKTLTAYKKEGCFGFYYDAEKYELKELNLSEDKFSLEIAPKDESENKIWINAYQDAALTNEGTVGMADIPFIGKSKVGAYGELAFVIGYAIDDYRETAYSISTEKGYLYISVNVEAANKWREPMQILDTFLIEDVNWEEEDVSKLTNVHDVLIEEASEILEENAEINVETK